MSAAVLLSNSFKGALAGVLLVYAVSQWIDLGNLLEQQRQQARLQVLAPALNTDMPDTLAHRLLRREVEQGLAARAELNTRRAQLDQLLGEMIDGFEPATTPAEAQRWLAHAAQVIDRHFRYRLGGSLSEGLVRGVLDCDLRVFVYLAAAERLGDPNYYFVLAPGHALVGWQRDEFAPLLWETTVAGGELADLSNVDFYQPVASFEYGDYQLASNPSRLLEAQLSAHLAWQFARRADEASRRRARALFQRSLEQFPSANNAAAQVMFGSDNLVRDMPTSREYAEYNRVYPYALGSQLYRLSLLLVGAHSAEEIQRGLEHASVLIDNGVEHPVLLALFERYGSRWQQFNAGPVQALAARMGRALYSATEFTRAQDRVAEGRAWLLLAALCALAGALLGVIVGALRNAAR